MDRASLPIRLQEALADYAARLRAGMGERLHGLSLFGSWARGEAGPDSDVDVFVLVDRRDALTRMLPFDASMEVLLRHEVDIAPTLMDEAEWQGLVARERRIARDIASQGIPL